MRKTETRKDKSQNNHQNGLTNDLATSPIFWLNQLAQVSQTMVRWGSKPKEKAACRISSQSCNVAASHCNIKLKNGFNNQ